MFPANGQPPITRLLGESTTHDTDLPQGWLEVTLDQLLLALESGSRPSGGVRHITQGVPSIGGEHVNEEGGFRFENVKYVPQTFFERMNQGHIRRGDVLIVKDGATTGRVALVRDAFRHDPAVVNEHVFVCRPTSSLNSAFLFYFLFSKDGQERIMENFRGSAQGGINQTFAPGTVVSLAPLAEQMRIVKKIEELLASANSARDNLSRVPTILRRFHQAVLAAACSGRLTEGWREQTEITEDASHLLERLEVERRKNFIAANGKRKYREPDRVLEEDLPRIPRTWRWTNFDHCSSEITVGHVGPMKNQYVERGISFLRCQNVRPLRFDPRGLVYIPPDFDAQLSKSKLYGGEILVVRSGANTGDCCVFPRNLAPANCSDLVITRPLSGLCPEYAAFYVNSPTGRARLSHNETGIAQPHFNIGAMRIKAFPLPPVMEQREIVRRVEALFRLADAIEEHVASASLRADKLNQSILAKAFRGELVPTEAELARREGREYEPASVLLERIKKERESQAPEKPGRKHTRSKATLAAAKG
jgi:type I restriction enzyme S subunit